MRSFMTSLLVVTGIIVFAFAIAIYADKHPTPEMTPASYEAQVALDVPAKCASADKHCMATLAPTILAATTR